MEQAAEAELAVGRHREIVAELQAWVAEHPLDERLRGHLMLALYRGGRQADALAVYREGRALLVEDLGIEPSRELRELERLILTQDRCLDLSATRHPVVQAPSTAMRSSVLGIEAFLDIDGTTVALDRSVLTIGRLPDRDVVLEDAGVSRLHAEVRRLGVGTGSSTSVPPMAPSSTASGSSSTRSADGDVIRFGGVDATFRTGAVSDQPGGE